MIEVEIKAKISNPNKLQRKFEQENGNYIISLQHEDTYYNMPKKLRDFKKTDEALRIRKSIEYNKQKNEEKATRFFLTYKGAKLDTSTKTRKELETKIKEGDKIKEILEILGFRSILTVKKERDLYEFEYNGITIEALIDYIPILDKHFIEVEIQTESKDEIKQARTLLFEFLKRFQIGKKDSIRKSYLELILEKLGTTS